jgi:hypothetical protein
MAAEPPRTPAPPDAAGAPAAKQRGCLFRALVGLAILVALVVVGGYLGYRYAVHRVVAVYTEPAPLDLGEPGVSPAELGELHGRLASFAQALRNKRPTAPLVLTAQELTALVAGSPDFQRLGGRARFSIGGGEIEADLSLPLDRFGHPGRWFNGSASFAVTLENGVLIATLRSASVRGQAVPGWIVEQLGQRNLAKNLYENPQTAAVIARLESIEVGEGRVTIVPRSRM